MLWHSTIFVIPYTGFTFLFSTFILPLVSIKNINPLAHCFTFICNYFPLNAEKNRKEKKWNEKRWENLLRLLLFLLSRPLSRSGAGINNFSDSTRLSWLGHGADRLQLNHSRTNVIFLPLLKLLLRSHNLSPFSDLLSFHPVTPFTFPTPHNPHPTLPSVQSAQVSLVVQFSYC